MYVKIVNFLVAGQCFGAAALIVKWLSNEFALIDSIFLCFFRKNKVKLFNKMNTNKS